VKRSDLFTVASHKVCQPQGIRRVWEIFLASAADGVYEMTLKRVSDRRTSRQNRYLWKLCEILAEAIGYGETDHAKELVLSDAMERLGFGSHVNFRGRVSFVRDSTALKDVEKFGQIIDELHAIADFMNEDVEPERHIILPGKEQGLL
jgi:hypothetical protein